MTRYSAAGLLAVACALGCGRDVATLELGTLGTRREVAARLTPGDVVSFDFYADSYKYAGENHVLLEIELLRDDKVVDKSTCRWQELHGASGAGTWVSQSDYACRKTVPKGGATRVRASAKLESTYGTATFQGLAVRVRDHGTP